VRYSETCRRSMV